ncbi:acetylxylan esterase [Haloferula chungangensis]|uniref:Acetylxylan esterase n=1 Tax=Haloferula chungangensis TaxID=1048331 RepID=A0ABW2L8C3_9BACT
MKLSAWKVIVAWIPFALTAHAGDFTAELDEVRALAGLTKPPVVTVADGFEATGTVKPIYFEALDWKGSPTKVFAWLGLPKNTADPVPGIVLVHGGGGTAFKNWVELWNQQGFAAISIAVEGQTDVKTGKSWNRHSWAGPSRNGIYGDSDEALKDQWMYHAVADTVLANSLLRSLPEVDAEKVGVMGISWGGVITSTVMGIDDRFAFAIPVYGCGNLATAGNQYGRALGNNALYQKVWDPMIRLADARMPSLWFSWPGDQHFPLDLHAGCYQAAKGPHLVSLIPGMGHGHGAGWRKPDSYAFAKSIVADGKPWCEQTGISLDDGNARVEFRSKKPFEKALLVTTSDSGITGGREWQESPAELSKDGDTWVVTATLPEKTTAWFVNLKSGDLTASSDFQEQ